MKRDTKAQRTARLFDHAARLGFTYEETDQLRRIEMTLHRWAELECGDSNDHCSWSIERDEQTDKPFLVTHPHQSGAKSYRRAVADREKGALRRLQAIIAARNARHAHPIVVDEVVPYHQTDPRGCALYLLRRTNTAEPRTDLAPGDDISAVYTRGLAVCI